MAHDTLGEFEQALLLSVAHLGASAYGAKIRQEIAARTGRDVAVGAIYTSLRRLELKGLVRSSLGDPTPERGGRAKRFFSLRVAGADALRQARERHQRMWKGLEPDLRRTK